MAKGMLLIISGPSGVGKTTITRQVAARLHAMLSVSMTTRAPGPGDVNGRDYHFVDLAAFAKAREAGELLESAEVFGNCYGTPRRPVEKGIAAGRLVILEIDVQGAIQIKQRLPGAFAIFVLPPSEEVLLERLRKRRREDEAAIQRRFGKAKAEIAKARESGAYDVFICNDDLERAVAEAVGVVEKEVARRTGGGGGAGVPSS